jgi:hypothetical protein
LCKDQHPQVGFTVMENDIVPEPAPSTPGAWDKLIEAISDANLPKFILGPAGEALARLIAGGADIPAAWLQQKARAIRDKTEAQSLMTRTLAGAAAELVREDPALVQRAAEAFIAKEIGHQHNRERIALKTIEHLTETPDAKTTKPDDDWLNIFARHAQEASSDRMQELWSKILTGQLRKANAFSLQTLRFVSELDEGTAALFEKWSAYIVAASFLPYPAQSGMNFAELMQLEDFGLLTGITASLSHTIEDGHVAEVNGVVSPLIFPFRSCTIMIGIRRPFNSNYRCAVLTRIGRELYPITKTPATIEIVKAFVQEFPKHNVVEMIALLPDTQPPRQVLWSELEPQPVQQ